MMFVGGGHKNGAVLDRRKDSFFLFFSIRTLVPPCLTERRPS